MWDLIVSVPDHCLSFYFVRYCDESYLVGMKDVFHISLGGVMCIHRSCQSK